jgi:DNA-directed RNA polymerase specialized sigma24 family protein
VPVHHDDFAEFYEASYRRMVALVTAMTGDQNQAEDIAQEAFARADPAGPETTCVSSRPAGTGSWA